jgi:hypothetical protein
MSEFKAGDIVVGGGELYVVIRPSGYIVRPFHDTYTQDVYAPGLKRATRSDIEKRLQRAMELATTQANVIEGLKKVLDNFDEK